jgi:YidC/Oxa1 family membrane protein insertase
MAGSMIFQSKMTMQDPKQKAMVYLMPIFMLLIFNQFPSGLNLYYTLFNVLTIIQQKITDNDGAQKTIEKK